MLVRKGSAEYNDVMLRAAELYYERQLTQHQIANKLVLTRWKVGRLLLEAREAGIVRIEIVHPHARRHDEERQLIDAFGLIDAVVVPAVNDPADLRRHAAKAAAEYLCDVTPHPRILGVSWGRTLDDFAAAMPPGWTNGVEVVQINGAVSRSRRPSSGADVASEIARQGRGTVSLLSAPAIVERAETRRALESDPAISDILNVGRAADARVFSLGALSTESVLVDAGYLTLADIDRLHELGATGDVLGRFLDTNGNEVDPALSDRTIGLTFDEIRNAPLTIAVATGSSKAEVARAAAANGLCSVLVTDSEVASMLMDPR